MPDIFAAALTTLDDAIRDTLFGDIEISPPGGPYRTVRGAVEQKAEGQDFEGFSSRFAGAGDTVELDMTAFVGVEAPAVNWLVRFRDELGVLKVMAIAGPLTPSEIGPRFRSAPLKDLDPEDERRP